ncbi:hypothetical protein OM076_17935 [Solirubrobacter ginsenosidimutans]|uniref:Uncharacterized protein n=1 Tax=Solirubrobacter ginsenosidimutans TaxID=490573 RepID=A0A9X3MVS3_9ACTN|nr:hypothetical protein [Solirubrobacter ginsenosidimutans]MDA0162157.1 hypothetical protein [Solirubrobacter ginsenosidimutans]
MTRLTLALIVLVAFSGCGAELTTARTAATATPKPPPRPTKVSKACSTPPAAPKPSTAQPSARLLDALAVLRRPMTAEDAPPANVFVFEPFLSGVMLDAARRVHLADGSGEWIVPVGNLTPAFRVSEACLRTLPAEQRKATRKAIKDSERRPATEGAVIVRDGPPPQAGPGWSTDAIAAGKAFHLQSCTGPMHNHITLTGVVPDAVTQVTITAQDGALVQATPIENTVSIEQDRPDSASGLPAHITSTTSGAPLEYALDPRATHGYEKPCEPPSNKSIGKRREPPTKLEAPKGAAIELETSRWQPEDSGPEVAGATYRAGGRRCLLVASEKRLRAGQSAHRFCVSDAELRAKRFIVRAARLPNGDPILEGFVDREQASWIVVERSTVAPGAWRLPAAKSSGAFFVAFHGKHARGGSFTLHAALRGGGFHYSALQTVRLNPTP